MPEDAAQYLSSSSTGERFAFLDSDHDSVRLDWFLPPGGRSPEHRHPRQIERVTGVEGVLTIGFRSGDIKLGAGQTIEVPAGTPHDFRNESSDIEAHMIVEFLPALEMRAFFEAIATIDQQGRVDRQGRPLNPLRLATFAWTFRDVFRVTSPPWAVQRLLLPPAAKLGAVFGYRWPRSA